MVNLPTTVCLFISGPSTDYVIFQGLFACLVGWSLVDQLQLRDFGPHGTFALCVVITIGMVILLRDLGP